MIDEQQVEELRARMARVVIRDDPAWMAEEARPLLASIDETLQQAGDLAFPLPSDLVVALQRVLSTAMDRLENGVEEARRNPRVANIFAAFALRTYLLALVSRVGLPAGFWRTLTGLCLSLLHEGNAAIRGELAWLLALAAADPRFMDARELLWALRWVQSNDPVIVLHRPDAAEEDGFVMSLQLDEPPEPKAWFFKRADSPEPSLSFSLEELAKRAEEEIRQLDGIDWTMRRRVEGGVTADGRVALLRELLDRWRYGWQQRLPRKPFDAMAELLVGWEDVLRQRMGLPTHIRPVRVTDVSISGYELRWTDREQALFFPGQVVAIRAGGDLRWILALVRWLRQHPHGLQMGIQAVGFEPEVVALSHGKPAPPGFPAQMALAVRKTPPLRVQPALICPTGTIAGSRLAMASEPAVGQWLLSQVRFIRFEAQTRCVEVFQYEVDPFPED